MHLALTLDHAGWQRSSFCSEQNGCVEVARVGETYALRDGKNPHGAALIFDHAEWQAFISGVKAGQFDYDAT